MEKLTFDSVILDCRSKKGHLKPGLAFLAAAWIVFLALSVFGQDTAKMDGIGPATTETASARVKEEIITIQDLMSQGLVSQEQANDMLIKLKVKLADLEMGAANKAATSVGAAGKGSDSQSGVSNPQESAGQPSSPAVSTAPSTSKAQSATKSTATLEVKQDQTNKDKKSAAKNEQSGDQGGDGFETNFVAGVEQSGYSAQVNNTNFFLNAFFRDTFSNRASPGWQFRVASWGRIRLLSAPQPSTEGIVSILTDPTGKISQTSFTQVGQVADFIVGPEFQVYAWNKTRLGFIGGFGATTPLSSNTTVVTYDVPPPNTAECQELVNRFGQNSGYMPYIVADPAQATCIYNPLTKAAYNYIAFSNQDRSNFLSKWGMGFRLERQFQQEEKTTKALGVLDIGVGQDETVTGGRLKGWVFKIDSVYPLPIGTSLLYAFGSVSMRILPDKDLAPLILTVPQGKDTPTVPSTNVIVLPLKQPNRDFYRIGFGLNVTDVFCAFKKDLCNKKNSGAQDNQQQVQPPNPATNQNKKPG